MSRRVLRSVGPVVPVSRYSFALRPVVAFCGGRFPFGVGCWGFGVLSGESSWYWLSPACSWSVARNLASLDAAAAGVPAGSVLAVLCFLPSSAEYMAGRVAGFRL